jgi:sugar phosphate isomerase/epimerase
MLDIYISTLAFKGKTIEDIIELSKKNNYQIEFSSGLPYRINMEAIYCNATIKRVPHNYFPAPIKPFVLNLASSDDYIRNMSIEHCLNGLRLAKVSTSPFFSAHAGFCLDPKPEELGSRIKVSNEYNREENKLLFINSLKKIVKYANDLNIDFLIENNVIANFNISNDNNPLLCCESIEIKWMFDEIKNYNFGLLLDTGHLKVSCKTLDLNIDDELSEISKYIRCIHHSDNNGLEDNNCELTDEYWFLSKMSKFKKIPHVIEVKNLEEKELLQQIKILESIC